MPLIVDREPRGGEIVARHTRPAGVAPSIEQFLDEEVKFREIEGVRIVGHATHDAEYVARTDAAARTASPSGDEALVEGTDDGELVFEGESHA